MARRDEGAYPPAVCDRGATKPDGLLPENPPGGGSFARGRRWLVPYSPLRGCSELAALATAKIPRRRPPANFKSGSKIVLDHLNLLITVKSLARGLQHGGRKIEGHPMAVASVDAQQRQQAAVSG